MIELGFLHLADELPGVGAEALDVAPLSLGIDRVHGQGTLARAAGATENGHLVAGNIDVDALEVVLPGAADSNHRGLLDAASRFGCGRRTLPGSCRGMAVEQVVQCFARVRVLAPSNLLGRSGDDDPATLAAAFRAEVDDPIGRLDHVQVVLDDQHGVARVDEIVQHLQQQLDVGEVQPGGRLV